MLYVRSCLFNLCYTIWTIAAHILALPFLVIGNRHLIAKMAKIWIKGILLLLQHLCKIQYRELGLENLQKGPAIYAVKHQSAWETLFLVLRLNLPAFVLKRELLSIPLFGRYLESVGMIAIDRTKGLSAVKAMMAAAGAHEKIGRSIVIFPEGTRVPPGEKRKYHSGVAALYQELGLPVVPVALNSGLFWAKRAFLKRPGTISIHYLLPIAPGLERKEFMQILEQRIEEASAKLLSKS